MQETSTVQAKQKPDPEQPSVKQAAYASDRQARAAAYWTSVSAEAPEAEKPSQTQTRRLAMRAG